MEAPLVSVICLCYNHKPFVEECIDSVLNQTHKQIEIIIVDDASTDGSKEVIEKVISNHPEITFLNLKENQGSCKAFNKGLAQAKGDFIVDLATDDVLLPERIEKQLTLFDKLGRDYGVVHTNARYVDEAGNKLRDHTRYLKQKGLVRSIPEGDVYKQVLCRYFISSPTMLVRKEVFDQLGGYDEQLVYEDFDFWVRSARNWKYAYIDEELTQVRKLSGSMSDGWYKQGDWQLHSTYLICKKAAKLNKTPEENKALIKRLKYEVQQSVFSGNFREAKLFYRMLKAYKSNNMLDGFMMLLASMKVPLSSLRKAYHKLRYQR